MTLSNLPNPPPGAHQVQLELWRRVLHRRYNQIGTLSPSTFHTFSNDVASDYANSLRMCSQIDLSRSHYSSFLLPLRNNDNTNNDNNNTAKQITFHFLALFYTAIDERSSPPVRQFSIDVVKRAFSLLDDVMKRNDKSNKRDSSDGDGDGDGEEYVVGKHGRDEDEEEEEEEELVAEMPKTKHARKNHDDTNTAAMDVSGDSQNNQADLSNNEAEHETEQQSNNIMSTGEADEERGETADSSNPSSASNSKQHHESNEDVAADEMQVDGNNDHDNMKSNSQQTKEFRIRTVREVLEEDAKEAKKHKKQVEKGNTEPRMESVDRENATQSNELEEATMDHVGGEEGKLGTSLNMSDVSQNPGDADFSDDGAEHPFNEEVGNSFEETEGTKPLPSKEGDNSVEETVPANDDVAKPAESDVMRDEPQLKESDETGAPHGEGENIDEVIETEAKSIHSFEPTNQAGAADTQPVLGAVGTKPIAQTPLPPPRVYSGLRHLNFYAVTSKT